MSEKKEEKPKSGVEIKVGGDGEVKFGGVLGDKLKQLDEMKERIDEMKERIINTGHWNHPHNKRERDAELTLRFDYSQLVPIFGTINTFAASFTSGFSDVIEAILGDERVSETCGETVNAIANALKNYQKKKNAADSEEAKKEEPKK